MCLIASTDLLPQERFTFLEMLAMVMSESSFGGYVCQRRTVGLHRDDRLCFSLLNHNCSGRFLPQDSPLGGPFSARPLPRQEHLILLDQAERSYAGNR